RRRGLAGGRHPQEEGLNRAGADTVLDIVHDDIGVGRESEGARAVPGRALVTEPWNAGGAFVSEGGRLHAHGAVAPYLDRDPGEDRLGIAVEWIDEAMVEAAADRRIDEELAAPDIADRAIAFFLRKCLCGRMALGFLRGLGGF